MTPEMQQLVADIEAIKHKLNQSNDTDPDYMSPLLKELRNYVLQVHASFERSLEIIIWKDYLKSSESFWHFTDLFERMTFEDKRRIAHKLQPDFPNRVTVKLNELRNFFAHQRGELIRNTYNDDHKRLEAFEFLEEAHDAQNAFFAARQAQARQ